MAKPRTKARTPRDESRPGDVIPSLMDVLSEAMVDKKKDYADVLPLMRKDNGEPMGVRTIKRYLAGTHFPTGRGIDLWARAVTEVTGAGSRFPFYLSAIERAEEDERAALAAASVPKSPHSKQPRSSEVIDPKAKRRRSG